LGVLLWSLLQKYVLILGVLAAAMVVFFLFRDAAGWRYGETLAPTAPLYLQATTACLVGS
jgi:sodium/potassium-transporting ATPase subunit alpha